MLAATGLICPDHRLSDDEVWDMLNAYYAKHLERPHPEPGWPKRVREAAENTYPCPHR
jgi:hypothetical protein